MSSKDLMYFFRPISFIDDPWYFLGKAIKIRKQRKKYEKYQNELHEELTRLRNLRRTKERELTNEDLILLDGEIDYLKRALQKPFESRLKIGSDDYITRKALKIERAGLRIQNLLRRKK